MPLTTDPNDPRLGRGTGGEGMNAAYLAASSARNDEFVQRPDADANVCHNSAAAFVPESGDRVDIYGKPATVISVGKRFVTVQIDGDEDGPSNWHPSCLKPIAATVQVLLTELAVRQSEKRAHLRTEFQGRLFKIETDAEIGREGLEQWTRPVRLRFHKREDGYEMLVRDA